MTLEEAKEILSKCQEYFEYEDLREDTKTICLDGRFTNDELEAILTMRRAAAAGDR